MWISSSESYEILNEKSNTFTHDSFHKHFGWSHFNRFELRDAQLVLENNTFVLLISIAEQQQDSEFVTSMKSTSCEFRFLLMIQFLELCRTFFRTNLSRIVHTEKAKMLSIVEGYQFLFVFWMRTNQTKLRFTQHCWCYVYTFLQHIGST